MKDQKPVDPQIVRKVRELVAQTLRIKPDDVKEDASLVNDLGAESIDLLELRFLLEKSFKIPISEKELRASAAGKTPAEVARNLTAIAIAREIERRIGTIAGESKA